MVHLSFVIKFLPKILFPRQGAAPEQGTLRLSKSKFSTFSGSCARAFSGIGNLFRGQRTEDKGQRIEDGRQRTEDRAGWRFALHCHLSFVFCPLSFVLPVLPRERSRLSRPGNPAGAVALVATGQPSGSGRACRDRATQRERSRLSRPTGRPARRAGRNWRATSARPPAENAIGWEGARAARTAAANQKQRAAHTVRRPVRFAFGSLPKVIYFPSLRESPSLASP